MNRLFISLLALLLSVPARAGETEDVKLTSFFKRYLEAEFQSRPLEATRLGDHRFDHRLDAISPKARAGWTERTRKALACLPRMVDYQKLSRSGQIDYEILKHHLTRNLWLAKNFNPFENDPRVYNEYITESVYLLLTQSTEPKATNLKNAAARMAEIPRIVAVAKKMLGHPPKVHVETSIRQNRGAISFYQSGIFEIAGESPQTSLLAPAAKRLVAVLKDYQKFLEDDLLPRATGDWRIGEEKFAKKLELELDAGLTAAQVFKEAEAEFSRVERDMYVIARQLWSQALPNKPLPADDVDGRRAAIQQVLARYNQDHGRVEDLVRDARATVKRIKAFIQEKDILRLPSPDQCQVIEMPEFQRGFSTAYLNPAPPLDPKARSYYAVSPPPRDWDVRRVKSFMEEYNRCMIQILTIHEAYPGHYVQLDYSNQHPSVIRRVLYSGVFQEGWAVYTEQMMLDQGYGNGQLVLRLNQLKWYLRAVGNAILDHKMHCTQMTVKEALEFLMQRAFQSEGEALGKIVRAKLSSCQLSTYFVGRTAFYKLRQAVQREQGDKFELARFHEAVLTHGSLPVKYLPEVVRERLKRPR